MLVLFLCLKFGRFLFFWVGKLFSYFSRFRKFFLGLTNFQLFFGSSNFCITHLSPLNEEHTVLRIHKIIVAFHIYSNFDKHCILSHCIFLGLNFGAFYILGLNLDSFSDEHPCQRNAYVPPSLGLSFGFCIVWWKMI